MSAEIKPRVLVVDDEESVRTWLKSLLASLGCEIAGEATDGREGFELFKKEHPDLVLLDLKMPEVGGEMALDLILAEDPDARVVLLTSVADSELIFEHLTAGARCYIHKHAPPEEIKATLREQIEEITQAG